MQKQSDLQQKLSFWKYIISAMILMFTVCLYLMLTYNQFNSNSRIASNVFIRQAAAQTLNKFPKDVTKEDITEITRLVIQDKKISDIKPIIKYTNLQTLILRRISFREQEIPKPIALLGKLGILDQKQIHSIDLSPIEKLNNLHTLHINSIPVKNIKPLSNLVNLKELLLIGKNISDLESINGLKELQKLDIRSNSISSLEPLTALTNLKYIRINCAQVSDLTPLKELKNLQILHIYGVQAYDIEPLKSLRNLKELYLVGTQVSNLEPLKDLKQLESLQIFICNNITDEQVEELQKALPNLKISR